MNIFKIVAADPEDDHTYLDQHEGPLFFTRDRDAAQVAVEILPPYGEIVGGPPEVLQIVRMVVDGEIDEARLAALLNEEEESFDEIEICCTVKCATRYDRRLGDHVVVDHEISYG